MPLLNTLVSYRSLTQPFPDTQTLLSQTRAAAGQVIADSAAADARVSQLAAGLAMLRTEQGAFHQVMHTPRNAAMSLLQTHIAQNAVTENKLESFLLRGLEFVFEGFEVRFSSADWFRWMLSFFTWIEAIDKEPLPSAPAEAAPIDDNFTVALFGDWGTGLYGAPVCAQSIQNEGDYDLLLHLGDVYYSGRDEEVSARFQKFWPNLPDALGRSLNGNHEMYTGGHGYFRELLPGLNQTSSYFAFQNANWTLVALDTAYDQPFDGQTGRVLQPQIDWLRNILAAAGDRKVVLFTHRQPFTLLDNDQGTNLMADLQEFLQGRKIWAWYWGHEHRLLLYEPHPLYGFRGRCVGHGGFPQARPDLGGAPPAPDIGDGWFHLSGTADAPNALILDTANVYIPGFEAEFAPHGYMRLEFRGAELHESVRAAGAANIYDRPLT